MMRLFLGALLLLPFSLFASVKFANESEVSVVQTSGNSVVETYNAKTLSKWEITKRTYSLGAHYTLGTSENVDEVTGEKKNVESARNWDVNAKYEQKLTKALSGFLGIMFEGNEYTGIKQRENYDLGGKHFITKTDKLNSFYELGVRYTVERTVVRDKDNEDVFNYTKGRFYYEIDHKKSETFSYKFWLEYLPNFTETEDYLINAEPSVAFVINSSFSLKTAYKIMYDNVPNIEGNKYTDTILSTSLIAKF